MSSRQIISPKDRGLLDGIKLALSETPTRPLCPDFYQLLSEQGYDQEHPAIACFEALLLDDAVYIVNCLKFGHSLKTNETIALFDQYLSCVSRRIPHILEDKNQSRIALEAVRRLAFAIMEILFATDMARTIPKIHEQPSHQSTATQVLPLQVFLDKCDALLQAEHHENFVIIGVQFEIESLDSDALERLTPQIIQRFTKIIRDHDLIAQISSKKWALGLKKIDDPTFAILAAEKIRRQFEQALRVDAHDLIIKPAMGIALSSQHLNNAAAVLKAALAAAANPVKHAEGYQFHDPQSDILQHQLNQLSPLFKKALFDNALELYFQPQFSLSQQKIVGLEALLRWHSGEEFIPIPTIFNLIERDGLLDQFTQWLVQTALRHLTDFNHRGVNVKLSINVLPENLVNPDFCSMLASMLDIWQVAKDQLFIEITESSMLQNIDETLRSLAEIKQMGLNISMDDFGTGYSSLSYLSRLPIDELKIDQAFVRNMQDSPRDEALVRTIIEMGKNFQLELVAEGVETEEIALHIGEMGCDIIQGYWFSKPVSAYNILQWIDNDQKNIWQKQRGHPALLASESAH